jgi:hypothetical protein
LAAMRAPFGTQKKARMYRNPPLGGKPIRLVNLVEGKVRPLWAMAGLGRGENGHGQG